MRFFNINIIYLVTAAIFLLSGCSKLDNIERILELSGDNRSELETVLNHFKENKFKYDAACFLIENMESKHYYEGWQIDSLKAIKPKGRMNDDEIANWKDFDYHRDCRKIMHLNTVKADLLIKNIDIACDVWLSRPWSALYAFEDFCEYVLPYCIGDEPLEDWRSLYFLKYASIVDSVMAETVDVIEIASAVANKLKSEGFDNHADIEIPHLGALYLMKHRVGYCRENCDIATYAMRSLGIPVATDFYIESPSYNSRHFWNAIIDIDGTAIPFNYTEQPLSRSAKYERKMGKVYRNMFGKRYIPDFDVFKSQVPPLFTDYYVKDVSIEYFKSNPPLKINSFTFNEWMFLSIYNGGGYTPIDISPSKNGTSEFKYIEEDIIVFPTIYRNGMMNPCSYPILTGEKNTMNLYQTKSTLAQLS